MINANSYSEFLVRAGVTSLGLNFFLLDSTEAIFKIGSTAAPSLLYDALDHFEKKSPRADENIRQIKNELPQAVNACLLAAANETSYTLQSSLLRVYLLKIEGTDWFYFRQLLLVNALLIVMIRLFSLRCAKQVEY
jgi:hypothetical protein